MKIIGLGVNNRIGWPGSILGRYKTGALVAPVASGTIPSQTVQQGTGVITYTTSGAFTGPVSSWSMTGGAAGISINSSTGVVSVDRAVVAVNVYSLAITASNAAGSSAPVGFSLTVSVATLTLRQQIEGLSTQTTPNGRQSTNTLQVASAGNLPPGCSLAANVMTFSGSGVTLEDWDFGGYSVRFSGTDQTIQNCKFGPYEAAGSNDSPIQLNATSVRAKIRYNTFDGFDGYGGPVAHIKCVTTGSGAAATGPQDYLIEYNRFLFPQSDVIKGAGNGLIQWNYFGPLTNYPTGTTAWSAGTTYAAGQYVLSPVNASLALFRSFSSGNTGNSPATSKNNTAFWESLDPHGDCITQVASDGIGVIIRRNLIDWGPAVTRAVGTTQAIRIIRNNKSSVLMGPVDFSENVVPGPYAGFHTVSTNHVAETYGAGSTYSTGDLVQSGAYYYTSLAGSNIGNTPSSSPTFWELTTDINAPGPIRYLNNWIGAGSLGSYFNPPMANAVDAWSNNADSVSGALIAGPVLRVSTETLVASVIGQSENEIGFAKNNANSTSGPYPVLLSGVDARIALHGTSDNTGVATLRTLDAASITAKTVSPGFVGLANLWHLGSSGRPLRLVADVVSGTSMTDMMDDAVGDGREFSASASLVSLAQGAWGNISRVVYNWWNAEASSAKTLWNSRSAHFFGVNSDGSPYNFTAGPLEHCLIDTTNRGYGLLSSTAKLDLMLPGLRVETATGTRIPPNLNYRTDNGGGEIFGMIDQNSYEAYAARDNVLTLAPTINRGVVSISPALVKFGDYSGGVQLEQPSQSSIHPSLQNKDGQILFSQDVAAHFLIAENHAKVSTLLRVEPSGDLTTFDFVFDIPLGGTLTTQRILDVETVATPRPHQQAVMGFVIARGADTDRQMRPLYRTDNVDAGLYPTAYRGTATILNTGTDVGGSREAKVRVVLSTALAAGDRIHFGTDGGYGGFGLHGYPDHDAMMYRDGLRVYEARLDDGSATRYPGIPVRAQRIYTVVSATDVTAPLTYNISVAKTSTTATLSWSTNEANGTAYWLVDTNATRTSAQVISGGGAGSGSSAVTAVGIQSPFVATGLTAATPYYFHMVHVDAAGNASIVSDTSFTTDAAVGLTFTTSATGPYFIGQTDLPVTSQITFAMKIKPVAAATTRYLVSYAATSIVIDVTNTGSLRVGVEDGAGVSVRAGGTGTGINLDNGVWNTLIFAIDLAAATLKVRKNGTLSSMSMTAAGTPNFQTIRRGTFLNTAANAGQLNGEVEYIKVWYSAEADGSEPVAAPFATIAGNAAAVNGITTPFLQSGSPAT